MELFGVGAAEALLVLVIALIVVGPQRFPEIARQGGRYYRTARRYANEVMKDVRGAMADIEKEIGADDLRSVRELGREMGEQARGELRAVRDETTTLAREADSDLKQVRDDLTDSDNKPKQQTQTVLELPRPTLKPVIRASSTAEAAADSGDLSDAKSAAD